ncbi:galactitol-1-phosphate 5-dehydrogenase [uncultured Treponema sp.]|uniref:galactitol-1-phosphate 5-dehydrogenase n=1 Tax=uncultured Treponema sp. TaxID=162155 RepID=UPI0025D224D3|nr:galactitol-1-phosphate 5-dehydrogenase [uncultured Treponema sp.]
MKAQVLYGINQLKYESDYKKPDISRDEVLVKVKACGICGSDIDRVLKNGTYHFPTIIGHEFSGEVVESASKENDNWIGKRVSIFPLIPCRKCTSCQKGDYQLCENYNYLGSRCDGGFAEYVSVPVWNLIEIPDCVSYEEAAMLEPSAVALHALKICGTVLGKKVLITGSGTIATILAQIAIAGGAAEVVIAARNEEKLTYIKEIITTVKTSSFEKLEDTFDIVIEGTGASIIIEKALNACIRHGTVVFMGNPVDDVHISKKIFWQILRKELIINGTWNSSFGIDGKNDWADIFSLIKNKKLNLEKLITHKLKLEELLDGILLMKNKNELSNKVMVVYE